MYVSVLGMYVCVLGVFKGKNTFDLNFTKTYFLGLGHSLVYGSFGGKT